MNKMKKLVLLFTALIMVFAVNAQTISKPTEVVPDSFISGPQYAAVSDSLTNTDTTTWVFRVKGYDVENFTVKLYLDWVSGTAGGVLTPWKSIDGVNYSILGDTIITASSVTADVMDTETIDIDDFLYPYLKLIYIQSGTAVTRPKIYVYNKRN